MTWLLIYFLIGLIYAATILIMTFQDAKVYDVGWSYKALGWVLFGTKLVVGWPYYLYRLVTIYLFLRKVARKF
jgi:hypothetical protein